MKEVELSGKERKLKSSEIISTRTDVRGLITFANPVFCLVTGYTRDEVIGQPHNIIRHPEVPRAVYYLMWETIRQGETFFGITVNRCKNGDHYWTLGYFNPETAPSGEITGFRSTRQGLRKDELKEDVGELYRTVREVERQRERREQIKAGLDAFKKELKKRGYSDYQDFAKLAL